MVEQGIAQSRERAKALIMEGVVLLDGVKVQKASDQCHEGQGITIKENPIPFVSRGGLKLQKAVDCYGVELKDKVCIDVGASTGGFTDCMLMHGAKKVYAVDVGYGQLDWKLRNDDRVVCMERHNARIMNPDWFSEIPAFASVDGIEDRQTAVRRLEINLVVAHFDLGCAVDCNRNLLQDLPSV